MERDRDPDLDDLGGASAGAQSGDADDRGPWLSPRERAVPDPDCLNCEAPLIGNYCAVCGQRAENPRRLVIGLVQDVVVDTISIDSKLVRTLIMLFWRPGRLARNYIDGKRARYTAPFRLYLFSSLIFFLLVWTAVPFDQIESGITGDASGDEVAETVEADAPDPPAIEGLVPEPLDEAPAPADGPAPEVSEGNETAETPETDAPGAEDAEGEISVDLGGESMFGCPEVPEGEEPSTGDGFCLGLYNINKQLEAAGTRAQEDPRLFFTQVRANVPRAFLLAPVFYALILMVFYIYRRKFLIYDHLVVSLYMHAALFGYLSAVLLLSQVPLIDFLVWPLLIYAAFQPVMVFRQAYDSNWFSTLIKYTVSNTAYFICIVLLMVLGLGFALYQS